MLKRYWKHGAAAILGVISFLYLVSLPYSLQHGSERRDAREAKEYVTEEYIKRRCASLPINERALCSAQERDAVAEEKRSEYDLKAQQEMAKWALLVLVTTVLGLFVSAGGLVALVWTFREQRKLTQNQERAVLEVCGGAFWELMRHGTPTLDFEVLVKNTGKTHANNVRLEGYIQWHPGDRIIDEPDSEITFEIDGDIVELTIEGAGEDIPPGEKRVLNAITEHSFDTSSLIEAYRGWGSGGPNIMGMAPHLTFKGQIWWQDVFEQPHNCPFFFQCYFTEVGTPTYLQRGGNNWRELHHARHEEEHKERREMAPPSKPDPNKALISELKSRLKNRQFR